MADFDHEQPASSPHSAGPPLDAVEQSMIELASAEQAGVFQSTPMPEQALQAKPAIAGAPISPTPFAASSPPESPATAAPVSPPPIRFLGLSRKQAAIWLTPIAAAVILAVGFGAYLFQIELGAIRERRDQIIAGRLAAPPSAMPTIPASPLPTTPAPCDGDFLKCCYGKSVTGLASRCAPHDYNHDGTIDLSDYQTFQIGFGQAVRNN